MKLPKSLKMGVDAVNKRIKELGYVDRAEAGKAGYNEELNEIFHKAFKSGTVTRSIGEPEYYDSNDPHSDNYRGL